MHINKCNCLNFAEDIVKIQLIKQSKVSMMVSVCFIRAYGALLHVIRILNIDLPKKSWSDFLSFIPPFFSSLSDLFSSLYNIRKDCVSVER